MKRIVLSFALLLSVLAVTVTARGDDVGRQAGDLLRKRAEVLFARGDFHAARDRLRKAIALHDVLETRLLLGRAELALGDCRAALETLAGLRLADVPARGRIAAERTLLEAHVACDAIERSQTERVGMVRIEGGTFSMGSERGEDDERPVHSVTLRPFWIDRTEVTVADFERCVADGACHNAHFRLAQDVRYCNYGDPTKLDHPMNCVDYAGAQAYCAWAGKRLLTEAEWELAARGTEQRTYPWGEEPPDCTRAIMEDEVNDGCGQDRTFAVGSRPAGATPEGVLDMSGNVWEWVSDWYGARFYATSPTDDPSGPSAGTRRCMRGGSWLSADPAGLRGANREHDDVDYVGNGVGLRCAADCSTAAR